MTADAIADDATLAQGVAAGDVGCLAAIYDRYSGPLLGFCQNMLRRRADAEDCLQDVFVVAATRLGDLREPALLRSWLYSVARHECLARLDRRHRELLMDDVPDSALDIDEPASATLDDELAALLRDMNEGLSDRDRLLLELADRQQLTGDELAGALGVPRSTAYTLVGRARTTARTSIGALLVARTGREDCPELDQLLTGWDGQLTTLRRKQIARHIDKCDICTERRNRVATPLALLGEGTAFAADLVALRLRILTAAAGAMVNAPSSGPGGGKSWSGGWPPTDAVFASSRRRRWLIPLAALFALLLLIGGRQRRRCHQRRHDAGRRLPGQHCTDQRRRARQRHNRGLRLGSGDDCGSGPERADGRVEPDQSDRGDGDAHPPASVTSSSIAAPSTSTQRAPSQPADLAQHPADFSVADDVDAGPVTWTVTVTTANGVATVSISTDVTATANDLSQL